MLVNIHLFHECLKKVNQNLKKRKTFSDEMLISMDVLQLCHILKARDYKFSSFSYTQHMHCLDPPRILEFFFTNSLLSFFVNDSLMTRLYLVNHS